MMPVSVSGLGCIEFPCRWLEMVKLERSHDMKMEELVRSKKTQTRVRHPNRSQAKLDEGIMAAKWTLG